MDKMVLFDPEFKKLQDTIKWLKENKHAILDDARLNSEFSQKNEIVESDEYSRQHSGEISSEKMTVPNCPSVVLQDLVGFTDMILRDIDESINSNTYSNDLELQNELYFKKKGFLEERCKNYAHQLYDMITTLISCEEYSVGFFRSYDTIYRLVINTDGTESAIYLRRLVNIARSIIPVMQRYLETSVESPAFTSNNNAPEFSSK